MHDELEEVDVEMGRGWREGFDPKVDQLDKQPTFISISTLLKSGVFESFVFPDIPHKQIGNLLV